MKNAEVQKIRHWSAMIGQLGRSENNRSHFKNIPPLFFPLPIVPLSHSVFPPLSRVSIPPTQPSRFREILKTDIPLESRPAVKLRESRIFNQGTLGPRC